jgi:hypothetical protein
MITILGLHEDSSHTHRGRSLFWTQYLHLFIIRFHTIPETLQRMP